jgi:hypothetical protein
MSRQIFLTPSREYECHAIAIFESKLLLQVVDDGELPSWHRAQGFTVRDGSMPSDWIVNLFDGEPKLVIGPAFVAESIETYAAMVQQEPPQIDLFLRRLHERDRNA